MRQISHSREHPNDNLVLQSRLTVCACVGAVHAMSCIRAGVRVWLFVCAWCVLATRIPKYMLMNAVPFWAHDECN